jgi:hypothetical protein
MIDQQLVDGSKWTTRYYEKTEAVYKNENSYFPIPPIVIPITFSNGNVIVYPYNPTAPIYWWLGAKLEARVTVPGIDDNVNFIQQNLRLNQKTFLQLPTTVSYSLQFEIPWRFNEMTIGIWEYDPTL